MAWVEQVGRRSWRVRYRVGTGGCGSVSGFTSRAAAVEYVQDLRVEQRRGTWLDPSGAKLRLGEWVERWIDTIDVETRTEKIIGAACGSISCRAGARSSWVRPRHRRWPSG